MLCYQSNSYQIMILFLNYPFIVANKTFGIKENVKENKSKKYIWYSYIRPLPLITADLKEFLSLYLCFTSYSFTSTTILCMHNFASHSMFIASIYIRMWRNTSTYTHLTHSLMLSSYNLIRALQNMNVT